jgi:methyl-accepting chemotaxis protein
VSNVQSGSQQVEQAGQSMQEIVQSVRRVSGPDR